MQGPELHLDVSTSVVSVMTTLVITRNYVLFYKKTRNYDQLRVTRKQKSHLRDHPGVYTTEAYAAPGHAWTTGA